jgi:hypothetical protein
VCGHFLDTFLGAIFGGIVTIFITIWIERLRSPQVCLAVGTTVPISPRGPIQNNWRSLRIEVSNRRLPKWAIWWMSRLPAQQCRAEICFLRLDGTPFLTEPMRGRWAGSPEPKVAQAVTQGGTVPVLINPQELKATVDIYPGDVEQLDVAIRVDQEQDAYGWSDETYYFPDWRNPARQLNHDRYLIKVTVTSSGRKCTNLFRIDNDGPFASFSLAEPTPPQRQVAS